MFGDTVQGGLIGEDPKLDAEDLDEFDNMQHEYDFRQVYLTLLCDWFGISKEDAQEALGSDHEKVPFLDVPNTVNNESSTAPISFKLHQNYPNPFNPVTTISFTLQQSATVRLQVFDVQGRLIQTMIDRRINAGNHSLRFDASGLSSGTYVYRLQTGNQIETKSMTLIK